MQLKEHVLYGGAVTAALAPVFGLKILYFFFATVLIDSDHYIDYLYFSKFKNWNVKKMFRYHHQIGEWRDNPNICALEAFHTVEFLAGILLVAWIFRSVEVLLIFSGMTFHLVLDIIRLSQWRRVSLRAFSFFEYWYRTRKLKRKGVHPDQFFEQVYETVSRNDPR